MPDGITTANYRNCRLYSGTEGNEWGFPVRFFLTGQIQC